MGARRRINKDHPDYSEYMRKCEDWKKRYIEEDNAVEAAGRAQYPDWRGKDSPWGHETRCVMKKYHAELKALQQEYDYLFTEEMSAPD